MTWHGHKAPSPFDARLVCAARSSACIIRYSQTKTRGNCQATQPLGFTEPPSPTCTLGIATSSRALEMLVVALGIV
jgi:hypothetical protein